MRRLQRFDAIQAVSPFLLLNQEEDKRRVCSLGDVIHRCTQNERKTHRIEDIIEITIQASKFQRENYRYVLFIANKIPKLRATKSNILFESLELHHRCKIWLRNRKVDTYLQDSDEIFDLLLWVLNLFDKCLCQSRQKFFTKLFGNDIGMLAGTNVDKDQHGIPG